MAAQKSTEPAPVEHLNTQPATIYTHIHPILVLSLFYASFSSTVQDPVESLRYLVLPLALLQAVYAATCIPQAPAIRPTPATTSHSQTSTTPKPQTAPPTRRKPKPTQPHQTSLASRITQSIFATTLSILLTTPPLFIVLVLHGAPLTTHIPHTALLATHMSLLTTLPLFYAHGVSSSKWKDVVSLAAPVDELTGAAIGALVGAWLGAIPIPLDWDREWQKWPVTVVTGVYLGWAVGKLLGGSIFKGWKVKFND